MSAGLPIMIVEGRSANPVLSAIRGQVAQTEIGQTFGARPTGVECADAIDIRIPIEGAGMATGATA